VVSSLGRFTVTDYDESFPILIICFVIFLAIAAPYAIIGGLSGFQNGSSSFAQRAISMLWLVFGQVFGLGGGMWLERSGGRVKRIGSWLWHSALWVMVMGLFSLIDFWMVFRMLRQSEICALLG
jgi:hypothetical protein